MNLSLLAPELFLSAAALGLLALDCFVKGGRRLWINLAALSVVGAALLVVRGMGTGGVALGMAAVDGLGQPDF